MSDEIDDRTNNRLVQKVALRYLRSVEAHVEHFDKCRRMERWWQQVMERRETGDEDAILLGYAFSVVERMHANITEPLFQGGVPIQTYSRRPGFEKSVKNLQEVQKALYSSPTFQAELSRSKKSMCIVGHRWEIDGFLHTERMGMKWGEVGATVQTETKGGAKFKAQVKIPREVRVKRTGHYGFHTEFLRWDQVLPEPDRSTIDTGEHTDVTWLNIDRGYLTLEDLAQHMTRDPNTGANVPLYDFGRLLHSYGKAAEERYRRIMDGKGGSVENFGAAITPERAWDYQASRRRGRNDNRKDFANGLEDRDKLWIVEHREMGEILTIAQGRFVILRRQDPWHVPGLYARIENYFEPGDGRLYGKGAIEPIEGELTEIDDIHNLSMQNIFRDVNTRTFINEASIVSMEELENPRAGGLVRIKGDQADVRSAVYQPPVGTGAAVQTMLSVESDLRGLIERVSADLDGAPGNVGSKLRQQTAAATQLFVNTLSPMFSRWQRQARGNEARRCANMAALLDQFMWEKTPFRCIASDGAISYVEIDRRDLDTGGAGFDFVFDVDPLWGSPAQKLMLKRQVFKDAVSYMNLPPNLRGPNGRVVHLDDVFEEVLRESGYADPGVVFAPLDHSVSPEQEYAMLAQGQLVNGCRGDLMAHVRKHLEQLSSPTIDAAIQAGKVAPDLRRGLQLLVQQAMAQLRTFLADPEAQPAPTSPQEK